MHLASGYMTQIKNGNLPTGDDFFRGLCDKDKKCPRCGKKTLFYNADAGPIVGGIGTWKHPPNAHPIGMWECMNCDFTSYKLEYEDDSSNKKED